MNEANARITEDRKNLIAQAKKKRSDEERYKSELLLKIKEDAEARLLKEARNRAMAAASTVAASTSAAGLVKSPSIGRTTSSPKSISQRGVSPSRMTNDK
jgi:sialic acid synthase SpsE